MALTRERITVAALEVIREEGLGGLSMRKVASRLDVEAMSLYRYVRNKADLLDAVHDTLIGQVPMPGDGPWSDEVWRLAVAFRSLLFSAPAAVPLLATRPASTPGALRLVDAGVALLQRKGFSPDHAVVAFQTVFCFVIGHAVFHTAGGVAPEDSDWARREFEQGLRSVIRGLQGLAADQSPER